MRSNTLARLLAVALMAGTLAACSGDSGAPRASTGFYGGATSGINLR
ncbi:hypothetical protein [Roseomonas marmotae]|uniref:Uncharacterized protein n=1 Tax=Roseomonas marmotae TaxID=2768161 RepID=A0ABS3KEW0_9PROT|nr:hypothetical protein [Roseomonas marmotae]MBO1076004.1 hypothetical protein [Roseomonas marmotae]QTI80136.1 hypothetical protein IAI58_05055 [Roseomonas marmotae]